MSSDTNKSYFVLNDDGVIVNEVVCDDEEFAKQNGWMPFIKGYGIGDKCPDVFYLSKQLSAFSDQNEFLEDCIVEMAGIVYDY